MAGTPRPRWQQSQRGIPGQALGDLAAMPTPPPSLPGPLSGSLAANGPMEGFRKAGAWPGPLAGGIQPQGGGPPPPTSAIPSAPDAVGMTEMPDLSLLQAQQETPEGMAPKLSPMMQQRRQAAIGGLQAAY